MWSERNAVTGRIDFWDIMKGIGILSIVAGHGWMITTRWVYSYHLALFFFISGFLFNTNKWGKSPFSYIGGKLGNLLPKFMLYSSILIVMHNLFINLGFYADNYPMSFGNGLTSIISTMFFYYEQMGGALWFVPVLIIACGIFACTVYIAILFKEKICHNEILYRIIVVILSCILGNIGILYNLAGMELDYHSHTSFLMIPVICAAWLMRESKKNLEGWINIFGAAVSLFIMYYFIQIRGESIELSQEKIIGPYAFYIVTFSGIYFCMYLSKLIGKISPVRKMMILLGTYSFEIMAFHFLVFKVIDLIITNIYQTDPSRLSGFPISYAEAGPIYLFFGCLIPVLVMVLLQKLKNIRSATTKSL